MACTLLRITATSSSPSASTTATCPPSQPTATNSPVRATASARGPVQSGGKGRDARQRRAATSQRCSTPDAPKTYTSAGCVGCAAMATASWQAVSTSSWPAPTAGPPAAAVPAWLAPPPKLAPLPAADAGASPDAPSSEDAPGLGPSKSEADTATSLPCVVATTKSGQQNL
jgi:hypothetical protein